jgi:hypothetical protein
VVKRALVSTVIDIFFREHLQSILYCGKRHAASNWPVQSDTGPDTRSCIRESWRCTIRRIAGPLSAEQTRYLIQGGAAGGDLARGKCASPDTYPLVAPTFHLQVESGDGVLDALALDASIHRWFGRCDLLRCASPSSSSPTQLARCLEQFPNPQHLIFPPRLTRPVSLRATRLPLTGNPSIVTRNSFLLLGLSFFHPSSQTGDTATQLCFVLFFPCRCLISIAAELFL